MVRGPNGEVKVYEAIDGTSDKIFDSSDSNIIKDGSRILWTLPDEGTRALVLNTDY